MPPQQTAVAPRPDRQRRPRRQPASALIHPPDWDAATPIFTPPPNTGGMAGALPKTGKPNKIDDLLSAGLEIGGMMLAPELLGGVKGFAALPGLVRAGGKMVAAGLGGATGRVTGDT